MKRSKHSLSNYKLATIDMGKLYPVNLIEALPGDTFQVSTSLLLRFLPMLAPVMHPVSVRIHHWFVPHRLVFPDWEKFITGGSDGLGEGSVYPTNTGSIVNTKGLLLDYLGVPPNTYAAGTLNMMPIAGYNLIYNEFYRDEDLVTEALSADNVIRNIAWEKDYFTTARPWAQKGPAVTVPLGTYAPVIPGVAPFNQPIFDGAVSGSTGPLSVAGTAATQAALHSGDAAHNNPEGLIWGTSATSSGLRVDLTNASAAAVNDLRRAFALQRYQEARAQYGSRYTEYLRYLGIRPSDARLQRPEYLGGGKQTASFSEVLVTAQLGGDAAPNSRGTAAAMAGHGIAALRSNRFRYFCEEHGYIFTLLSVRPRTMYVQGLERTWSRRTKEDYYQRELELIGQQAILNKELYRQNLAVDDDVWGYQDRYAEYRHQRSTIAGDFRDTQNFWHMARTFAGPAAPPLNASFVEANPSERIFAQSIADNLLVMAAHSVQARRLLGKKTIGRII